MQDTTTLSIKRHPTEMPLLKASILISLPVLAVLVILTWTLVIYYTLIVILILFVCRFGVISYIRGSGIRVTAQQLPEVYEAVVRITQRIGLTPIPEIYVLQGNGVLNAFAREFLFRRIIVIYSNLLEACENNPGARDMIIGHELGHLHAGHTGWNWKWLTWPSLFIPFLPQALSRAREYTADRYGYACVENKQDALQGLLILAAGKNIASKVSMALFTEQINSINTGFMRIGEWFRCHPTLVRRACALDNSLYPKEQSKSAITSFLKAISVVLVTYSIIAMIIIGQLPAIKRAIDKEFQAIGEADARATQNYGQ